MADWHPILAARETEPGVWYMVDTLERCYGVVRIIRRGDEIGYRADTGDGELVGHYRSLRGACEATHHAFITSRGPGSHPRGLGG